MSVFRKNTFKMNIVRQRTICGISLSSISAHIFRQIRFKIEIAVTFIKNGLFKSYRYPKFIDQLVKDLS